jgi:hypothetical protein
MIADLSPSDIAKHARDTCSTNPTFHLLRNGKSLPECLPSDDRERDDDNDVLPDATLILAMLDPEQIARARKLRDFLVSEGFRNVQVFPGLNGSHVFERSRYEYKTVAEGGATIQVAERWFDEKRGVWATRRKNEGFVTVGERGYRESLRSIIDHAIMNQHASVMVLEYDVVLHCQFTSMLVTLLRDRRCGQHVVSPAEHGGGVLVLGASIYAAGTATAGWKAIDDQLQSQPSSRCFNMVPCGYGSFATVYHRDSFAPIIRFLNDPHQRPFDHVYMPLVMSDVIVRVAHPFLAAADVMHASKVDNGRLHQDLAERMRINRWNASSFCETGTRDLFFPV